LGARRLEPALERLRTVNLQGNVLITGGSGTLGRAILLRARREDWDCHFTIFSRSELLQSRMRQRFPEATYLLGDVRDYPRVEAALAGQRTVIHAAALKRIPEAEVQPQECHQTDVVGSWNVLRACQAMGVRDCLGISTDKACRAVTAYGASKLLMEKFFQSAPKDPTFFHLVRYGNVVASNGSVIPIWREQARQDKPLPITDQRCTRFWLSEQDAVEWLLAALEQPAGTILVPKLSALPILELIALVAPQASWVETGLRSCEKLHEDLIHTDEPALDLGRAFLIHPQGQLGHRYTSETAPRLSPSDYLRMLSEAEEADD